VPAWRSGDVIRVTLIILLVVVVVCAAALTLLAQAVLTVLFGFLGLMVAVPLVATVIVIVQTAHVVPMERRASGQ
jgi:hypothetical protein